MALPPALEPSARSPPHATLKAPRTYRVAWAELLKKVFALDVLACPECAGRMQLIVFIAQATVARRLLDHLGLDSTGPPLVRPQTQPEQPDFEPHAIRLEFPPVMVRTAVA